MRWTPELIKWRRLERGWSQKDLADAVGVSLRSVTSVENGEVSRPRWLPVLDRVLGEGDPEGYSGPRLREASNGELLAEFARRLEVPPVADAKATTLDELIEKGVVPENIWEDPELIKGTRRDSKRTGNEDQSTVQG